MNKAWRWFAVLLVLFLLAGSFVTGGVLGWSLRQLTLGPQPTPITGPSEELTPEELRDRFETFWEVWRLVESNFYDPDRVNPEKMAYGAIKGMVDAVGDKYTFFATPAQTSVANTRLEGSYEGIGAYIDQENGFPVILGPVGEDTPAARAGLRRGDVVLAVDGVDVEGMPLEEVIAMIKGPAGTDVTLKILRQGEAAPFEVTITRAHIDVPSVTGEMRPDGLAYVRISIFGDNTSDELDDLLEKLLAQNPKGLILDLRGNGGGYLVAAQEVLGRFLRGGVATYRADREGNRFPLDVVGGRVRVFDLPMVVLVDGGSASASEIVAGALQDSKRAILIGEQTFGKGSIQNVFDLEDGSSVRVTVAHWLTPNGRQIQDVGLTPDIVAPRTPEDYAADRDPQLDTAVAYLLGNTLPPVAATPTPKP